MLHIVLFSSLYVIYIFFSYFLVLNIKKTNTRQENKKKLNTPLPFNHAQTEKAKE